MNLDVPAFDGPALCAETDPESFFPDKGGSVHAAKKVCGGCQVKNQCLQWALDHDERFGVWGGMTERERRKLREQPRKVQPINHGTEGGYKAHTRRGEQACIACREANRIKSSNHRPGAA